MEKDTFTTKMRTKNNERFLAMALGVALTSKCRHKMGAIVVVHGKIRGASPNIRKNSPVYVDWKYSSVHAEIAALRKAGFPKRATVYVARIGNGEPRLAKPCPNCQLVLDSLRCKVIFTEG